MSIHVRASMPERVATFRQQFGRAPLILDERGGIGPHHLAIGKTRKIFEHANTIFAFFSRGYEIAVATVAADTMDIRDTAALSLPVAWGGGAFCVDCDSAGRVALAFLHRNQHELCFVRGQIAAGRLVWAPWTPLLVSSSHQAAPWVELGPDGTAWCSVLDRAGQFRIAAVPPNGAYKAANLFGAKEEPWYHSCVQLLPYAEGRAVAVGFRGAFPAKTELVYKTVTAALDFGPAKALAPCNVNDRLTFHFQAVGDPARGTAHIVYLDEQLTVSHAQFTGNSWAVAKAILPVPCFAPQIALSNDGDLAMTAADYDGQMWKAARPQGCEWGKPVLLPGIAAPNISALFAQTGYGTGGLISAARSANGRVPFLSAEIVDEKSAAARLFLHEIGGSGGLRFTSDCPLNASVKDGILTAEMRTVDLRASDTGASGKSWVVVIPGETSRALKLRISSGDDIALTASWQEESGRVTPAGLPMEVEIAHCDAFTRTRWGSIRVACDLGDSAVGLRPERAWVESYEGTHLVDIAPFAPETAARMATSPDLITRVYKRMV